MNAIYEIGLYCRNPYPSPDTVINRVQSTVNCKPVTISRAEKVTFQRKKPQIKVL